MEVSKFKVRPVHFMNLVALGLKLSSMCYSVGMKNWTMSSNYIQGHSSTEDLFSLGPEISKGLPFDSNDFK